MTFHFHPQSQKFVFATVLLALGTGLGCSSVSEIDENQFIRDGQLGYKQNGRELDNSALAQHLQTKNLIESSTQQEFETGKKTAFWVQSLGGAVMGYGAGAAAFSDGSTQSNNLIVAGAGAGVFLLGYFLDSSSNALLQPGVDRFNQELAVKLGVDPSTINDSNPVDIPDESELDPKPLSPEELNESSLQDNPKNRYRASDSQWVLAPLPFRHGYENGVAMQFLMQF